MPASTEKLQALAAKWADSGGAERAHFHSYLIELADALGVDRPGVSGSGYEFEYRLLVGNRDGTESQNLIDLLKRDHFVLEAKDSDPGTPADMLLRKAFGQARNYALNLPGAPVPYVMVMDVGKTLMLWDRWNGSYAGYNAGRTIDLRRLHERPDDVALLRDVWTDHVAPLTVEEAAARFAGARRDFIELHLKTLALMGELQRTPEGRYAAPAVAV